MTVASPCIRACTLDHQDVCVGCGRTIAEIVASTRVDDAERTRIVAAAAERRAARVPPQPR